MKTSLVRPLLATLQMILSVFSFYLDLHFHPQELDSGDSDGHSNASLNLKTR